MKALDLHPDRLERDITDLFLSHLLDIDISYLDTGNALRVLEFKNKTLGRLAIYMYHSHSKPLTIFNGPEGYENMYEFRKNDHNSINFVLGLIHKARNNCDMCVFPYTKIK